MLFMIRFSLVFIGVFLFSGCASDGNDKKLNYHRGSITPTLEIPPDLTRLSTENNLDLPGSSVGRAENSGRFMETGFLELEQRTLPTVSGIRIGGQGDLHWLEVPQKAELIYPVIRSFWAEQGFRLIKDEPVAGVMETEWLSQVSGERNWFVAMIQSLRSAESRDQYLTRFERSAENTSTLIFIAHRGQQKTVREADDPRQHGIDHSSGWFSTPAEPGKEYEMLSRMMLFLGMQDEAVRQEMEKIGHFSSRASIVYDEDKGQTYLKSTQRFQQTWNRLIHRLDRLSIPLKSREHRTNEGQVLLSRAALPAAKGLDEEQRQDLVIISVKGAPGSNNSRVDVRAENATLRQDEDSRQLLQWLQQQLK